MIRPDQIPDGVVDRIWERCEWPSWLDARDALIAAINAWPGMHVGPAPADARRHSTILPLPQERHP